jgi:hypothetical protein
MTSYPYGQQQYYPTPQPAAARPGAVTALAIIGIVLGGIGLLCKPFAVLSLFIPQPAPNPAVEMQKEMMAWNIASAGVGTLISGLLLASSIGALMLKPWARKGMLAYAALAVVMNVVGLVVSLVWVVPKTRRLYEQLQQQQAGAGIPPGLMSFMQNAGAAMTVVAFVIAMVFPLLLWYFFSKADVKAAFEPPGFAPGGPRGGAFAGYAAPPAAGPYAPPGSYPPQQ